MTNGKLNYFVNFIRIKFKKGFYSTLSTKDNVHVPVTGLYVADIYCNLSAIFV